MQQDVFDEIAPLVVSAMKGFHVCIFAYGQVCTTRCTLWSLRDPTCRPALARRLRWKVRPHSLGSTSGTSRAHILAQSVTQDVSSEHLKNCSRTQSQLTTWSTPSRCSPELAVATIFVIVTRTHGSQISMVEIYNETVGLRHTQHAMGSCAEYQSAGARSLECKRRRPRDQAEW